jgi:hypothetical protein
MRSGRCGHERHAPRRRRSRGDGKKSTGIETTARAIERKARAFIIRLEPAAPSLLILRRKQ